MKNEKTELKDKIKRLRKEKGLTQEEFAKTLFVSRSAVAKWENGLGLPNPEAMALLEREYGSTRDQLATSDPENVIVSKNRMLRRIGGILFCCLFLYLWVAVSLLPLAMQEGRYGFTPSMTAGIFADHPYIDTGDLRIYYSLFEGDWEDGRHWSLLSTFKPVRKHFWGCTVEERDYESEIILKNGVMVGRLYSIQGRRATYNLIRPTISIGENGGVSEALVTVKAVTVNGEAYEIQRGFFFVTSEPPKYFKIGDEFFQVE